VEKGEKYSPQPLNQTPMLSAKLKLMRERDQGFNMANSSIKTTKKKLTGGKGTCLINSGEKMNKIKLRLRIPSLPGKNF